MLGLKLTGIFIIIVLILAHPVTAETINITVSEDSYINASANSTNHGSESILKTYNQNPSHRQTFIKFTTTNYTETAYVYIYSSGGWMRTTDTIYLYNCSSDWNENTITWNNQPSYVASTVYTNSSYIGTSPRWIVFNVSSCVRYPGTYSFMAKSQYGVNNEFTSKEGDQNYTPRIEINPVPGPMDINYNNKTDNDDKTFLVNASECIRFNITAPDSTNISNYTWYVNKVNQYNNNSCFDFTVPSFDVNHPSTGIWEIRVEGNYTKGTNVTREWLISGLTEEQAPNFIDYFVDQNNLDRWTADPWDRTLPIYYIPSTNKISNGYITGTSSANEMRTFMNITYGTFQYKVRVLDNNTTISAFRVYDAEGHKWNTEWEMRGIHDYFAVGDANTGYFPISRRWVGQAPSQHYFLKDMDWHTVTIIRTSDDWWSLWVDGEMRVNNYIHADNVLLNPVTLWLEASNGTAMDCVEIYKDKYIYPNTEVRYGQYPKWWYLSVSSTGYHSPEMDEGVIVFGRNLTLKQISDTLSNESLMSYNDTTKTALLKTNLFIKNGAELNIINETLLFDTTNESLFINPQHGVTFRIINSTISTTSNNPLIWDLASYCAMTVTNPERSINITATAGNDRCSPSFVSRGRFIVENSTINNTCNLFICGPHELILNNTVFSNMSKMEYGSNALSAVSTSVYNMIKRAGMGEKSIWITPHEDLARISINNISFVNPKDEINLIVSGGQWFINDTTIENSNLSNIIISDRNSLKFPYFNGYTNPWENSSLALLNCIVNENNIQALTNRTQIKTKYYADLVVKDAYGNPIPNAIITPTASNVKYSAESLYSYDRYDLSGPTETGSSGSCKKWDNAINLSYATTNANGRTSLPYEDVNNSIVLTDYVLTNETGTQSKELIEYEFVVGAPNLKPIYLQGISPDPTWYRKDPLISTYTITAITPDNSIGPHITGFAPSIDNPFNSGETKNFRVWTDEALTFMEWRVNGCSVLKGSLNYTWTISEGNNTIEFLGSNANGTVNQVWELGGSYDEPTQEIEFSPAGSTLTRNVSETINFSVSPDVFTTKAWYINGCLILNNTTSMSKCWSSAGTCNVTFSGSTSKEPVLHTWTVEVVEDYKEQIKSIIKIAPEYQVVEPKKPFNLSIKIEPETPITGTQLDFIFNSSMTSVINVTEEDLLKQSGAYTIFSSGTVNNSAGTVKNIYGFILGTSNVYTPGTMATANLTAGNRTGMAKFGLSNVIISDANSKSVPYTVTSGTVLIDTAPLIASIESKSVDEKSILTFKVSAKDADGDRLILSASGVPQGAVFNATSGNFTWTPERGQAGVYTITFKVSDGYLSDSENVTVTVNELNNLPVISSFEPLNGSSFSEGESIGISLNASDSDGQALNYSIGIDGITCSNDTEYLWETDYSSSGNHTIEVVISDGIDAVKEQHIIYINNCRPRWDVNEDGVVNILDITSVSQKCGTTVSKPYPRYDVNQDGVVNVLDLTIVGHHFGEKVE